jgi:hypothetical protein
VICTLAIPFHDRPSFFLKLFPALLELRSKTGHPHWIVVDEAHHLLPSSWASSLLNIPTELNNLFLITTRPGNVSDAVLKQVNMVLAIGEDPGNTIREFARITGEKIVEIPETKLDRGEVIAFDRKTGPEPYWLQGNSPKILKKRHIRKYAAGELGEDKNFYFKGTEGKLNLRAQNLLMFLQLAEGVDDETWDFHLKKKEYSEWFRTSIKDEGLAEDTEKVEGAALTPGESRKAIRKIIEKRYTGPA